MNNLKLNLRVLKFLSSLSPSYFPLLFIRQVLSNLPFFFNLWISAEIVNELTTADDEKKIWTLVAIALLGNFVLHTLRAIVYQFAVSKTEESANINSASPFSLSAISSAILNIVFLLYTL